MQIIFFVCFIYNTDLPWKYGLTAVGTYFHFGSSSFHRSPTGVLSNSSRSSKSSG